MEKIKKMLCSIESGRHVHSSLEVLGGRYATCGSNCYATKYIRKEQENLRQEDNIYKNQMVMHLALYTEQADLILKMHLKSVPRSNRF